MPLGLPPLVIRVCAACGGALQHPPPPVCRTHDLPGRSRVRLGSSILEENEGLIRDLIKVIRLEFPCERLVSLYLLCYVVFQIIWLEKNFYTYIFKTMRYAIERNGIVLSLPINRIYKDCIKLPKTHLLYLTFRSHRFYHHHLPWDDHSYNKGEKQSTNQLINQSLN